MGEINQQYINSKKAEALSGNGNGARESGGNNQNVLSENTRFALS